MTEEAMSRAIENLKTSRNRNGLKRYCRLQESLLRVDVRSDGDFQRAFKSFYRMRRGRDLCEPFGAFGSRLRQLVAGSGRRVGRVVEVAGQVVGLGAGGPALDELARRFDGAELLSAGVSLAFSCCRTRGEIR